MLPPWTRFRSVSTWSLLCCETRARGAGGLSPFPTYFSARTPPPNPPPALPQALGLGYPDDHRGLLLRLLHHNHGLQHLGPRGSRDDARAAKQVVPSPGDGLNYSCPPLDLHTCTLHNQHKIYPNKFSLSGGTLFSQYTHYGKCILSFQCTVRIGHSPPPPPPRSTTL